MRRTICLFLMTLVLATLSAQTQKGHVKTIGRPNKPGKGLSGVLIKVSEQQNEMLSNQSGTFSFVPKGKKFMLSRIRKKDYQLIDQSVIGRLYPYSAEVPMEIVMVSNQDLQSEKQRIEDKAYERAERNYQKKIAELEKQLAQHDISDDEASKERVKLGENYQRYLSMIGQMAERYATTDYDGISETNERIMQCIERAELERADSLLRCKGDFIQREAELREQESITREAALIVQRSLLNIEARKEDLAQDYYNKHSIYMGNYQNDSAAYCMERRSLLDTTRVEWLLQAGAFVSDYLADYPRAIGHFRKARNNAEKQFGPKSMQVAVCCNYMGSAMMAQGRYASALDSFAEAKDILDSLPEHASAEMAECYKNIAAIYLKIEDYPYVNASRAWQKAAQLAGDVYGRQSLHYARLLLMKAGKLSLPDRELSSIQLLLDTLKNATSSETAHDYCNLGIAYMNISDAAKAHGSIQHAIDIWLRMFGERHPYLSYAYSLRGDCYVRQRDFVSAEKYYRKALENQRDIYGDAHPFVADCFVKLSQVYRRQGQFGTTAKCMMDALNVLLQLKEYNERDVISHFQKADAWLCSMEMVPQHSDIDLKQLKSELSRLFQKYHSHSGKKIRLKKILL